MSCAQVSSMPLAKAILVSEPHADVDIPRRMRKHSACVVAAFFVIAAVAAVGAVETGAQARPLELPHGGPSPSISRAARVHRMMEEETDRSEAGIRESQKFEPTRGSEADGHKLGISSLNVQEAESQVAMVNPSNANVEVLRMSRLVWKLLLALQIMLSIMVVLVLANWIWQIPHGNGSPQGVQLFSPPYRGDDPSTVNPTGTVGSVYPDHQPPHKCVFMYGNQRKTLEIPADGSVYDVANIFYEHTGIPVGKIRFAKQSTWDSIFGHRFGDWLDSSSQEQGSSDGFKDYTFEVEPAVEVEVGGYTFKTDGQIAREILSNHPKIRGYTLLRKPKSTWEYFPTNKLRDNIDVNIKRIRVDRPRNDVAQILAKLKSKYPDVLRETVTVEAYTRDSKWFTGWAHTFQDDVRGLTVETFKAAVRSRFDHFEYDYALDGATYRYKSECGDYVDESDVDESTSGIALVQICERPETSRTADAL